MTIDPIQQQLITARENQILDAAVAVFAEKGFHATTIHQIARHAGIADGTIYNYFDSKTALLLAIFERMRERIVQSGLPTLAQEGDVHAALSATLAQSLNALRDNEFALFRIVVSEMMVNAELRRLYDEKVLAPTLALGEAALLAQADEHGIDLAAEDAALTMRLISALVTGLMIHYVMGDETIRAQWDELPGLLASRILSCLDQTPA